ncbi:MAG: dihydrolipoamide acetyltransferase [Myxococcota bacterium]
MTAFIGVSWPGAFVQAQEASEVAPAAEAAAATPQALPSADAALSAPEGAVQPSAPARATPVEDSDYAVRLRSLEERVNDLKERVFRSKARLILLRETVLNGAISGAKAVILHRNEMGSSFTLEQAGYALDGAPLFNKTDPEGGLDEQEQIELFNGSIVPGNHNISVFLLYRGNGYGLFSYLKGYTFRIQSSHAFTAEEGKITTVKVVAYEKGGFTTDLKDRPAIRYDVEVKQDIDIENKPRSGAAADPQAAPAPEQ